MATKPANRGTAPAQISFVGSLNLQQREAFLEYARNCASSSKDLLGSLRSLFRYRDVAYMRQLNTTAEHIKAVRDNMNGRARALQDMTVPIVMPQIESATAYQTGVFLTQYPIFGVVSDAAHIDQAKMFETALADQAMHFGWARELIKAFRNGYKYNYAPVMCMWKKEGLQKVVTRMGTDASIAGTAGMEDYSISGNAIKTLDVYNTFCDPIVAPADLHKDGEFFGYNEIYNRVMLMKLLRGLDNNKTAHITKAYESVYGSSTSGEVLGYHAPKINQYMEINTAQEKRGTNWGEYMNVMHLLRGQDISYKDRYLVTRFVCRARPKDFGAQGNQLTMYHGIIINWQYVVFVEELSTSHDFLPMIVMQPQEDGLGYQTQSMLDNALPYQDMASSLWNIALQDQRRKVFDRLVYNPKLIDKKDIDPASSVSRIPLRNANIMEKDAMSRAIYQIPYHSSDNSSLQMSQMIEQMADSSAGQNRVDRGQFQKGNKTAAEFQTVMGNSNSRQQMSALQIEMQFMYPLKEIIRANTLMFQPRGKLFDRDAKKQVDYDPVALREAILQFKITDGMLPADKLLSPELIQVFLQTSAALPALATEFDTLGMFLYWLKVQGANWAEDFRRDPQQQQQFLALTKQATAAQQPAEMATAQAQQMAAQQQAAQTGAQ